MSILAILAQLAKQAGKYAVESAAENVASNTPGLGAFVDKKSNKKKENKTSQRKDLEKMAEENTKQNESLNNNFLQQLGRAAVGLDVEQGDNDRELGVWGAAGRTIGDMMRSRMGVDTTNQRSDPREALRKYLQKNTIEMEKKGYTKVEPGQTPPIGYDVRTLDGIGTFAKPPAPLTTSQQISLYRLAGSEAQKQLGGSAFVGISPDQIEKYKKLRSDIYNKLVSYYSVGNRYKGDNLDLETEAFSDVGDINF